MKTIKTLFILVSALSLMNHTAFAAEDQGATSVPVQTPGTSSASQGHAAASTTQEHWNGY